MIPQSQCWRSTTIPFLRSRALQSARFLSCRIFMVEDSKFSENTDNIPNKTSHTTVHPCSNTKKCIYICIYNESEYPIVPSLR